MIVLDTTIVNVALPSIRQDLGFSETSLAWVVNAYLLTFGGFLLLGGRLGDLFGHRRLFLFGIALFTLASLACGLATSQHVLIVARAVQGLGGAIVSAVALSLIMTLFTEAARAGQGDGRVRLRRCRRRQHRRAARRRAHRTCSSWHWIFLVNLPIGVAVFGLCLILLPGPAAAQASTHLDVAGAVTVTAALMLAVYAIVNGNQAGWTSDQTLGLLGAAVVLLGVVRRDRDARASRRSCRSASSGCAISRPRTSSACCGRPACSPGSSSPRSTCSASSATARCRSAWRSCRPT